MKRGSQREKILTLLKSQSPDWVPAYLLPQLALSYTRRIHELRKNHTIEIRKEWVDGQLQTAYRWLPLLLLLLTIPLHAQELPSKPVAQEGQWLVHAGDATMPEGLVLVPRKDDHRLTWHVERLNSCEWCTEPMTLRHAAFDKKASSLWIAHSMLFVADIETTHNAPCFQQHWCREINPLMGQSRAQAYAVGGALVAIGWLASAELRHGDPKWRVGGFKHWWIFNAASDALSTADIAHNLAMWNHKPH